MCGMTITGDSAAAAEKAVQKHAKDAHSMDMSASTAKTAVAQGHT
jgi:predicted small metal-binding protein